MNRKLKLEELKRPDVETYKQMEKIPLTVVLDNIRSLNNIGAFFRTADAFNIKEIVLCGITAKPPKKDIHKTALGATESVIWRYEEKTENAVMELKNNGSLIYAVEQTEKSELLTEFNVSNNESITVVFGNEVFGVQQEVIDLCDASLEIPQIGTKHSLNVAVCAGIVMWELSRQMNYFSLHDQPVLS